MAYVILSGDPAGVVSTATDPFGAETELDVRAVIIPADWTPDPYGWVIAQQGSAWDFGLDQSGALWATFAGTGDVSTATLTPTATPLGVRVDWRGSDGRTRFWYKATTTSTYKTDIQANTGWTQLGANVTLGTGTLTDVGTGITIGKSVSDDQVFEGAIFYMGAADLIDGTHDVWMDPADAPSTSATSWTSTSATGETWTLGGPIGPAATMPVVATMSTASDPWSTSPTWVAISDRLRAVSIRRQATLRQPGQVTAGTATITVDNTDRAFDPTYTAGPFGTWTPGRRVRITTVYDGITYGLFEGFIADLPQRYSFDSPHYQEIDVPCIDSWADLNQQDLGAQDWSYTAIDALSPTLWWRMGDNGPQIATVGTSFGGSATPLPTSRLAPGLPASASSFNGHDLNCLPDFTDSSTQSLSLWFPTSTVADAGQVRVIWSSQASAGGVAWGAVIATIAVTEDGTLSIETTTPAGTTATSSVTTAVVTDGLAHHLAVVSGPSNTSMWLDGVPVIVAASGVGRLCFDGAALIVGAVGAVASGQAFVGVLSDVAFWSGYALTSADIAGIVAAGNGYDGDNTGTRIARVLDAVGWPAERRVIATGKDAVGPQPCDVNAAEMMRVAHASEGGLLFVDRDGSIRFRNRYWTSEETTAAVSQATFSDDGAADAIEWQQGGFDWGVEQWLVNQVTVSGHNSVAARENDNSVALNRALSVSTALRTSESCGALARKILRHRSDALLAARPWAGRPQGDEWASVLALELGDRVTYEVTPQGVGSQIQREMTVSTIAHQIRSGGYDWVVTVEGDPVDPTSYFVLGVSELGGADVLG